MFLNKKPKEEPGSLSSWPHLCCVTFVFSLHLSDSSHSLLMHIREMRIFSFISALFLGMCRDIVNYTMQKITPSVLSLVPKRWSCVPGISKEKQLPVTI